MTETTQGACMMDDADMEIVAGTAGTPAEP